MSFRPFRPVTYLFVFGFLTLGLGSFSIAAPVQTARVAFKLGISTTQDNRAALINWVSSARPKLSLLQSEAKAAIADEGALSRGWFIHAGDADYAAAEGSHYKDCFTAGCHKFYAKELNAKMLVTTQIFMKTYDTASRKAGFDVRVGLYNADNGLSGYQMLIEYNGKTFEEVLDDLLRKGSFDVGAVKLTTSQIAARVRFAILAEKTAQEHMASLEVNGSPAGARVFVDNEELGVLPFKRDIYSTEYKKDPSGNVSLTASRQYTVRIETDGFVPVEQTVEVKKGVPTVVTATLKRDSTIAGATLVGKPGGPPIPGPSKPARAPWQYVLGFTGIAAGATMAGFGISALLLDGRCKTVAMAPALACPTVYDTKSPAVALTTLGALLAAAGVTVLAIPIKDKEVKVSPVIGPGVVGVFVTGSIPRFAKE